MFKHILVPLDGSELAESVLPAAVYLAEKLGSGVTLVHVIESDAPPTVHGQAHLRTVPDADAYLAAVRQNWFAGFKAVECHVHTTGVKDVAQSIVEHSDTELDSDLIIMCSHGRGNAFHLFMGSIAQTVIAGGSTPVLLLRPDSQKAVGTFRVNRIVLPLDDDPDHRRAVPVTRTLASVLGAAVHLIFAVHRFGTLSGREAVTSRLLPGTTARLLELATQTAARTAGEIVQEFLDDGIEAEAEVRRGNPADVISGAAKALSADLIVLGTHGKSGMKGFWAGSTSHRLCSTCTVPMLLIPVHQSGSV